MLCLELPEADEQVSGRHASYSVRGKKFAYLLEDHHGDGRLGLCFKATEGMAMALLGLIDLVAAVKLSRLSITAPIERAVRATQ